MIQYKKRLFLGFFLVMIYGLWYMFYDNQEIDNSNVKSNNSNQLKYSKDIHPCLKDKAEVPAQFDKKNCILPLGRSIDDFITITETAYRTQLLSRFLSIYQDILVDDYYIRDLANPKFQFISGIEKLYNGDYNEAKQILTNFMSVQDKYVSDKKNYYNSGCYESDIDWILDAKSHSTFAYSKTLLSYIDSKLSSTLTLDKVNKYIETIERVENNGDSKQVNLDGVLKFILINDSNNLYDVDIINEYKSIFKDVDPPIHPTSLNIYNDNNTFVLSSQFDLLVVDKMILAQDILDSYSDDEITAVIDNVDGVYSKNLLISLMHLAELNDKYGVRIEKNVQEWIIKLMDDTQEYDNHINWLNFYINEKRKLSPALELSLEINNSNDDIGKTLDSFINLLSNNNVDSSEYFIFVDNLISKKNYDRLKSDTYTGTYIYRYDVKNKEKVENILGYMENYDFEGFFEDVAADGERALYDHINMLEYFYKIDSYMGSSIDFMIKRTQPSDKHNECYFPIWNSLSQLVSRIK